MDAPAIVEVRGNRLWVDLAQPKYRLFALLSPLDIPFTHVVEAELCENPLKAVEGWRAPGLGLPHLGMGTWRHDNVKDYVLASSKIPGLVITLRDEEFARVVVSVEDAAVVVKAVRAAIGHDPDSSALSG